MRWWQRLRRWAIRIASDRVRDLEAELDAERAEHAREVSLYAALAEDRAGQIDDFRAEVAGLEQALTEARAETIRERRLSNAAWQRLARLSRTAEPMTDQPEQACGLREQKEVLT